MGKSPKSKDPAGRIDTAALIRELKETARPEKVNVTYRLTRTVIEDFKKACDKEDLGAGAVLEAFMRRFIASVK
jgi:hypothetical protein